jgi:hypothetical protein
VCLLMWTEFYFGSPNAFSSNRAWTDFYFGSPNASPSNRASNLVNIDKISHNFVNTLLRLSLSYYRKTGHEA